MTVRSAEPRDAQEIANIYNLFVSTSTITFEEGTVPVSEIARRVEEVQSLGLPWLVAEEAGAVTGYAHAKPWRSPGAYWFSAKLRSTWIPGWSGVELVQCCMAGSSISSRLRRSLGNWWHRSAQRCQCGLA